MSLVLLGVLAVLWAVFLVPLVAERRPAARPQRTISRYRRAMEVLDQVRAPWRADDGSGGRWVVAPLRPAERERRERVVAAARRRQILFTLLVAATLTVIPMLLAGGGWWRLQVAADLAFAGYIGALVVLALRDQRARGQLAAREDEAAAPAGAPVAPGASSLTGPAPSLTGSRASLAGSKAALSRLGQSAVPQGVRSRLGRPQPGGADEGQSAGWAVDQRPTGQA